MPGYNQDDSLWDKLDTNMSVVEIRRLLKELDPNVKSPKVSASTHTCPDCGVIVPSENLSIHQEWHETIAAAIREQVEEEFERRNMKDALRQDFALQSKEAMKIRNDILRANGSIATECQHVFNSLDAICEKCGYKF